MPKANLRLLAKFETCDFIHALIEHTNRPEYNMPRTQMTSRRSNRLKKAVEEESVDGSYTNEIQEESWARMDMVAKTPPAKSAGKFPKAGGKFMLPKVGEYIKGTYRGQHVMRKVRQLVLGPNPDLNMVVALNTGGRVSDDAKSRKPTLMMLEILNCKADADLVGAFIQQWVCSCRIHFFLHSQLFFATNFHLSQRSMMIENQAGVVPATLKDESTAGAALIQYSRPKMSNLFYGNNEKISSLIGKRAKKYHYDQPGIDPEDISADNNSRKGALATAMEMAMMDGNGKVDLEHSLLLLPQSPYNDEQLLTKGIDFQGTTYNTRLNEDEERRVRVQILPLDGETTLGGKTFKTWNFCVFYEISCFHPSGVAPGTSTGFTPKRSDLDDEDQLRREMEALVLAAGGSLRS